MAPAYESYVLHPVGRIHSSLRVLSEAPLQGDEGAPDAWLEVDARYARALCGVSVGDDLILITWLDRASRDVLEVHPRNSLDNPLTGVFATRSPHRPNPLGLHRVTVREIKETLLRIGPIEAISGTPVVDIKAALEGDETKTPASRASQAGGRPQ